MPIERAPGTTIIRDIPPPGSLGHSMPSSETFGPCLITCGYGCRAGRSAALRRTGRDAALRPCGRTAARVAAGVEQADPRWKSGSAGRCCAGLPRRPPHRGRAAARGARTAPAAEAAATVALSQRAARGEAGLLRIGFGIASILGLLPDVLLRFRRAYPAVQLQLRDMSTPEQIHALAAARSTSGSCACRSDERLVMRPVLDERLVAALGRAARGTRAPACARSRPSRSSSSRGRDRPASTTTC